MQKGTFKVSGVKIKVTKKGRIGLRPEQIQSNLTTFTNTSSPNPGIYRPDPQGCSVEVTGVSRRTHIRTVKKFFQNHNKSGGGKIINIVYAPKPNMYTITFDDKNSS